MRISAVRAIDTFPRPVTVPDVNERISHNAQEIASAAAALFDIARHELRSVDDAMKLYNIMKGLEEKVQAITSYTLQQADDLNGKGW